jgi:hypothetical protein
MNHMVYRRKRASEPSWFSFSTVPTLRQRSEFMPAITVKQRLFSIPETSKIIGRAESSVWRDIRAGRLKVVHICGSTRVTVESIDALCRGEQADNLDPAREPISRSELAALTP